MSKSSLLSRTKYLDNIQRYLKSVARIADTHPDLFSKVASNGELQQIEEIINRLVTGIEKEKRKE